MFTFVISRNNNNDEFFKSDLFSVNHSNEKKKSVPTIITILENIYMSDKENFQC